MNSNTGLSIIILIVLLAVAAIATKIDNYRQANMRQKPSRRYRQSPSPNVFVYVIVAIVLLATVISYIKDTQIATFGQSLFGNQSQPQIHKMPDTFDKDEIQFPKHGTVIVKPSLDCVAPFSVVTNDDGKLYYIMLKSTENSRENITVSAYKKSGEPFETKVPLGTYDFYYAVGDVWYGNEYLFGPTSQLFKGTQPLVFSLEKTSEFSGSYMGNSLTLIGQVDGNYQNEPASFDDFAH
jgi:hypothetical protein